LTEAASTAASQRAQERLRIERLMAQRFPAGVQTIATPVGSIDGREIHRCGYQGTVTYVTGPCPPPWTDVGSSRGSTRQQSIYEQANMRARAEANLRREQQRFNELTRQGGYAVQAQTPSSSASIRCARAKAQRDEAYRFVGNNRTFEFIRSWDEIVYNACKDS
jgi:hypothetical protein